MLPNIVKKQKLYIQDVQDYIKLRNSYSNTFLSATWNYNDPATTLTQVTETDAGNKLAFVTWDYTNPSTILITPAIEELPIKQKPSFNFVRDGEVEFFGNGNVIYGENEENRLNLTDDFRYGVRVQNAEEIIPDGVNNVFTHSLGTANFTVYVNGFKYTNVTKTTTTVTFDFIPRRMDYIELKAVTSNDVDFSIVLLGTVDVGVELKNYTEFKWRENKTEKNSQYEDHSTELRTVDTKYNIDLTFNDIKSKKEFFTEYKEKPFMLHLENEDGTNEYFGICEIVGNSEKNYFDRTYSLQIQSTDYWRDI
jgi:hypothetical protein